MEAELEEALRQNKTKSSRLEQIEEKVNILESIKFEAESQMEDDMAKMESLKVSGYQAVWDITGRYGILYCCNGSRNKFTFNRDRIGYLQPLNCNVWTYLQMTTRKSSCRIYC